MKRYSVVGVLVILLIFAMQCWSQAQMGALLSAYSQVAPTHPGRPLRPSPGEPSLIKSEIRSRAVELAELNADIVWAQGLPVGHIIRTDIGTVEQRDDWVLKAQAEVIVLQDLMAELLAFQ